jgi:hypothetical protein
MKTYAVEKTNKSITLGFKDVNSALITSMIKMLNEDKNVALVRFIDQHPELCDKMLFIEVKKGKPEEAVMKASKAVSTYYSSIKK